MPYKTVKFKKYIKLKKSTWITLAILKSIRYRDQLRNKVKLMTLKSGDIETSNPCDIADAFNQFFSTIADTHVPCDNRMPESEFLTLTMSENVRTKLVEGLTFVNPNVDLEYVLRDCPLSRTKLQEWTV